jgi:signal transduction histidine kinase/CheY-like chemotaxis protein
MVRTDYGPDVNLEELRGQLAERLAMTLIGVGVLLILVTWTETSLTHGSVISVAVVPLATLLVGLGWGVLILVNTRPALARHLMVWGLTVGLVVAMWLSYEPWLPFLGLMLIFVSAMLVSGGEFAVGGVVAALAGWLTLNGSRSYSLASLFVVLVLGVALAWQSVRTLCTALEWAWNMQQRADRLLELARDRQGELSRALKSLDISNTLLRRTQRELIAARKQAEEARLMKEQFAANVSHELRTPLNLVLGFSEVMCLSPEVYGEMDWPPTLCQDVYEIYRSSRYLLEMINDVLDLSRFEMVGFTLNREPIPVRRLLEDAVSICEGFFRGRPVRLEADLSQDLPVLDIDPIRIRQVLLNLLNNAQRFTEEGVVRVGARRQDGEVIVSVSDTGPGIPADELPHLFEEFYQVDRSLHRKHGGAGLGLAICKRFVEAHDGRVWVESEEGVGSTFSFALPIPGAHVPFSRLQAGRPLELHQVETPFPILVVDPDPGVATLVQRHLEAYEVVWVEDIDQLMDQIALHHPRAVVLNAPPGTQVDRNGIPSVPVPLIECSLPSQAWVADNLAVTAVLTKPVAAERLMGEIERLGDVRDILVVDDDRGFCHLVERLLEANGRAIDVRRAYNGANGLRAMRARYPDLLLLDLAMPGIDGFRVLEEMQGDTELAGIPVVLLTATSYAEDVLTRSGGQRLLIHRPNGLSSVEVLHCLRAVVGILQPHYDERSTPELALAGA